MLGLGLIVLFTALPAAGAGQSQEASTLTTTRDLSADQAKGDGYPARLLGVVTDYGGKGGGLFVQDKTAGIDVETGDQDLKVLKRLPWWTSRRLLDLLVFFGLVTLILLAGLAILRRKVSEQTALIREWARREAALKEQYLELFENAHDIVFTHDLAGNFTSLNRAGERLTGFSRSRLIGENFSRILAPEYRELAQRMFESKLRGGPPTTYEVEIVARDGHHAPLEVSTRIIQEGGKPVGVQGIARDITERRRALESVSLLASIVESSYDAIVGTTPEGIVVSWNPGAEKLYGYAAAEAVGRHVSFCLPPDRKGESQQLIERLQKGERITHFETTRQRKDGQRIDVSLSLSPIQDATGKITGLSAIAQGITERKRAEEEQRKAREAAEAANRAKREFLANMSHEIRTPLNGIIGMTELVLETGLTAEQQEYLGMVRTSADTLLAVINDILDFSKIEAGRMDLNSVEFSLGASLGDTLRAMSLSAHQKGLELALRVRPEVPARVMGDPVRLRQVVINLVGNAIKFTERGEIVLEVEQEGKGENHVRLHFVVSDTGAGIPTDKQQAIFEPFTQVDSTATRRHGGTGLGLAISLQLVELMGGRVWVESQAGQGSRFHFTARFGLPPGASTRTLPPELAELAGLAALIVDDNLTSRHILEDILLQWKMRPELADGGWTALAALERAQANGKLFPLVLVDAVMPDLDGYTLVERMRERPGFAGVRVVMLTPAGRRGDGARCRDLGIAAYLHKPVTESDLLGAVLLALRGPAADPSRSQLITRHSLRESCGARRILLAEDNLVNRRLATRLLEKRGHAVTSVGTGREVLQALEKFGLGAFDVVLMDVQMPEIDGIQATFAIRKKEQETGTHLPIIAFTAHALKGDHERFLNAGMDGYVAKPIDSARLFEAIEWLAPVRNKRHPSAPAPTDGAFNSAEAMTRVGGDAELLAEMAELFLLDCPNLLATIRRAAEQGDTVTLEHAAHKLKGAVSHFSARGVYDAACSLETMGRRGDLSEMDQAITALEEQLDRLKAELNAFGRNRDGCC